MKIKSKKIASLLLCSMVVIGGSSSIYANNDEMNPYHTIGNINLNVGTSYVGLTSPVPKSVADNGSGTMSTGNIVATSGSAISNPIIQYKMVNSANADRSSLNEIGHNTKRTFTNSGSKGYAYNLKIWSKTYLSKDRRLNVKGTWSPDVGTPHFLNDTME